MSNYFGALLRSAGARPSAGPAGTPMRVGAREPTAPEVAFEQMLEVPPALDATAPVPPPAYLADRDVAPDRRGASLAPPVAVGPETSSPTPGEQKTSAPTDDAAAFTAVAAEGPVHPLVRAALRWVRAEEATDEAPIHGRPTEAAADHESHAAAAVLRPPRQLPVRAAESDPKRHLLMEEPTTWTTEVHVPARRTEAVTTLDLELPRASPQAPIVGRHVAGAPGERTHSALPPFELSIGTIHVTVDAPAPPRPAPSAAAPAARPAATARPAASRSDFTRARLPRSL